MKTQHTSGPWTHEGLGDITGIENDLANGCVGKFDVASVYLRIVPGKTEANARLIASAPDLLAALKDLAQSIVWKEFGEYRGFTEEMPLPIITAVENARAAIAKATGEQQ